jgi:hypothetical protein
MLNRQNIEKGCIKLPVELAYVCKQQYHLKVIQTWVPYNINWWYQEIKRQRCTFSRASSMASSLSFSVSGGWRKSSTGATAYVLIAGLNCISKVQISKNRDHTLLVWVLGEINGLNLGLMYISELYYFTSSRTTTPTRTMQFLVFFSQVKWFSSFLNYTL